MASKKKLSNKGEKAAAPKETKAAAKPKAINWDEYPEKDVVIIFNGKETKCGKPTAKILVEAGKAKLK